MRINHNRHYSSCSSVMNSDLLMEKSSCTDFSVMFWQVAVVEDFSYTETQVNKFSSWNRHKCSTFLNKRQDICENFTLSSLIVIFPLFFPRVALLIFFFNESIIKIKHIPEILNLVLRRSQWAVPYSLGKQLVFFKGLWKKGVLEESVISISLSVTLSRFSPSSLWRDCVHSVWFDHLCLTGKRESEVE